MADIVRTPVRDRVRSLIALANAGALIKDYPHAIRELACDVLTSDRDSRALLALLEPARGEARQSDVSAEIIRTKVKETGIVSLAEHELVLLVTDSEVLLPVINLLHGSDEAPADVMSDKSFPELMDDLYAGDPDASRLIFSRFIPRLADYAASYVHRLVLKTFDPEDVVQDVWLTFFQRATTGDVEFKDWDEIWHLLVMLTMRKCRELYKHAPDEKRLDRKSPAVEITVLADMLDATFEGMGEDEKRITILLLVGLSIPEISSTVERSEQTIRNVKERARKRARKRMHSYA